MGGVTVTSRKVNAHCEIDLTSSKHVLRKRVAWCYLLVCIRIVIVSHGSISGYENKHVYRPYQGVLELWN